MKPIVKISFYIAILLGCSSLACSLSWLNSQNLKGTDKPDSSEEPTAFVTPTEPFLLPTPTQTLAAQPTIPQTIPAIKNRIVYIKEMNIWSYNIDAGSIEQITIDGGKDLTSSSVREYFLPKISPDGSYLAFDSNDSFFYVYYFGSTKISVIPKGIPDLHQNGKLLGWDNKNNLYYTLSDNFCISTGEIKAGANTVELIRFDPRIEVITELLSLPIISNEANVFININNVSHQGNFISYTTEDCSGNSLGSYLLNILTGDYHSTPHQSTVLSHDESLIAYANYDEFEDLGSTIVSTVDLEGQGMDTVYTPLMNGYIMSSILWSPDDTSLAFDVFPILPEELRESENPAEFGEISIVSRTNFIKHDLFGDMPATYFVPGQGTKLGTWSPDGDAVVYTQRPPFSSDDTPFDLLIFYFETKSVVTIDHSKEIGSPDW